MSYVRHTCVISITSKIAINKVNVYKRLVTHLPAYLRNDSIAWRRVLLFVTQKHANRAHRCWTVNEIANNPSNC